MKWFNLPCFAALLALIFCAPSPLPAQVATNNLPGRVLVKLLSDYLRPQVYALNESTGTNAGTLLALNAADGSTIAEITVGTNPTDMAMSPGGDAIYVINAGSRTIAKVNLGTFSVSAEKVISTPYAANLAYPLHVAAGGSNLVYFTDGALGPRVTLFDYQNGTNIGIYSGTVGGMVLTHDGDTMYTFYQYGWATGGDDGTDYFSYIQRVNAATNDLVGLETGPFQCHIIGVKPYYWLVHIETIGGASKHSILQVLIDGTLRVEHARGDRLAPPDGQWSIPASFCSSRWLTLPPPILGMSCTYFNPRGA